MMHHINLRRLVEDDLPLFKAWLYKPHVAPFFGDLEEWVAEVGANYRESDWVKYFIAELEEPMGFAQFYDTRKAPSGEWSKEPAGTYGIDYMIGNEAYLHQGYGTRLVRGLIQRVTEYDPSAKQIIADPLEDNQASLRVLKKNGFAKDEQSGFYRLKL